ncbi:MAG: ParA family partition ATPase [Pseudomonadota bacterium]
MVKIITVSQQKGGAGKTAIAAQLAGVWASSGKKVMLVDSDPQGSLAAWHALRADDGAPQLAAIDCEKVEGWKVSSLVGKAKRTHDYVVIDTAPHAETAARTAVREADLVVIPVQPTAPDLWASRATFDLASGEKKPYLVVLNRLPARGKLADEIIAQLKADDHPVCNATLGNRTAFATAFARGRAAHELGASKAADEAKALARAVSRAIK